MSEIMRRIMEIMEKKNLRDKDLCEFASIKQSTFATWKQKGRDPKPEFVAGIARFLGVSEKYLLTGEDLTDTELVAERLHKDPKLRMLFDAADGAAGEDLELAAELLKKMKKNSGYDV